MLYMYVTAVLQQGFCLNSLSRAKLCSIAIAACGSNLSQCAFLNKHITLPFSRQNCRHQINFNSIEIWTVWWIDRSAFSIDEGRFSLFFTQVGSEPSGSANQKRVDTCSFLYFSTNQAFLHNILIIPFSH